MRRMRGTIRYLAGFALAALVMAATETGFPSGAQGDDYTHALMAAAPNVEKPPVEWLLSPHSDVRPAGVPIDMIVIHDTETPGVKDAKTIWRHFANPNSQVSAHYIIGKAGEIVQCVPDHLRAWHTGESYYQGQDHLNDRSIGIELVNAQTGSDPFTNAQYRSLIQLVAYLVATHNIPLERVVGHKDITLKPEVKKDPAANFSFSRMFEGVRIALSPEATRQANIGDRPPR
ncbi:N-acetylmuramoyl-L-alanine amidase [bacterium]|nr:N-acetylmuramoyl-L-alanine amidase [bacterium]